MSHLSSMTRYLVPFAVISVLLGGCADTNSAQQLALETLKVTAAYENQVDAKIAAERRFYKDQLETIRVSLGGRPLDTALTPKKRLELLENTWLYVHIRVETARDGLSTAGNILSQPSSLSWGLTSDYLRRGVTSDADSIAEARAKQAELSQKLVQALVPLTKQKARLKQIRKDLAALAAGKGAGDHLALAMALAKSLAEEIN